MWNKATWANKTKLKEIKEERPNRHVFSSKILFILRILISFLCSLPPPTPSSHIHHNEWNRSIFPPFSLAHDSPSGRTGGNLVRRTKWCPMWGRIR